MERGGVSCCCGGRGLGEDGKGRRVWAVKQKTPTRILEGVLKIRRYLLSHWYALSSAQKA